VRKASPQKTQKKGFLNFSTQINQLIGLIIPPGVEIASHRAAQRANNASWRVEQQYSRQYGLHSSMTIVKWHYPRLKDKRKTYELISRC